MTWDSATAHYNADQSQPYSLATNPRAALWYVVRNSDHQPVTPLLTLDVARRVRDEMVAAA